MLVLMYNQVDQLYLVSHLQVVVLLVVIGYLGLGRDETIRLKEDTEENDEGASEFERKVIHRLERSNDLLVGIRNSLLILIVLLVILALGFLVVFKGCTPTKGKSSAHVRDVPNTYNRYFSEEK